MKRLHLHLRRGARVWFGVSFALSAVLCCVPAKGDLIVDVDVITPGIQTGISVTSGSSVTVLMYYDTALTGPIAFNAFGVDLNWTGLGSAVALPASPPMAGSLTTVGPFVFDLVSGAGPLPFGAPLISAGLPPAAGLFSIGGVGLVDSSGSLFTFGGPLPGPIDLFGVTFTVLGAVGETIVFTPSGILTPGIGATPGIGPFIPGGDHYQALPGAPSATTFDVAVAAGVVTIVPEPGVLAYAVLGMLVIGGARRFRAAFA